MVGHERRAAPNIMIFRHVRDCPRTFETRERSHECFHVCPLHAACGRQLFGIVLTHAFRFISISQQMLNLGALVVGKTVCGNGMLHVSIADN